jgi:hypothetical protein
LNHQDTKTPRPNAAATTAAVLLGAWLAGTLAMWFVATQNFRTVDRILNGPTQEAGPVIQAMGPASLRPVLRHLSSELNRKFFVAWGAAEVALGLGVLALLLHTGRRTDALIAGAMLAVALGLLVGLTPPIISIGRAIDFLPRDPYPPQWTTFWRLHLAYTGLDGLKLLAGLALAWRMVYR